MSSFILRPAEPSDAPAINAIHRYYVLNSVAVFALEPLSDDQTALKLNTIRAAGLPFIVAVAKDTDTIIGYASLSPFRSAKGGYVHTVELSLYCHSQQTSKGTGTALVNKLLDIVSHPDQYDSSWIGESRKAESRVREILSVMSLDPDGREGGLGLVNWYKRFGFEEAGRLKRVGRKFDRWLDTIYLQRHIE